MSEQDTPLSRRRFLAGTAWGAIAAATGSMAAPSVPRAQGAGVKVGVLHPVTGALAYSGQQCRVGALMAIEDINKAGGIKSLGGAKIEALLGDAQSHAAGRHRRSREDERGRRLRPSSAPMPRRSAWPPRQAAAKYNLPHVVDVGVADQIVERGLKNTFRFGPGYKMSPRSRSTNLHVLNNGGRQAGEDGDDHPRGLAVRHRHRASCSSRELPGYGFEVKEVVKHANPTRDFNNIVLRMKSHEPRHRHPGQLLQRIRAAGAHDAAAEGAAQGDLLGAGRRGLQLQVRQGVSRTPPTASSTATTGSTRRTSARPSCKSGSRRKACSSPTRSS